jgi:hypothetical protein
MNDTTPGRLIERAAIALQEQMGDDEDDAIIEEIYRLAEKVRQRLEIAKPQGSA